MSVITGKIHGKEMKIANGAQEIMSATDISIDVATDMVDSTDHDSNGWKENLPGNSSFTGTATVNKVAGDASQNTLFSVLTGKTKITLNLYPEGIITGNEVYSGFAFINKYTPKGPNASLQTIDISFTGTGPLTIGVVP